MNRVVRSVLGALLWVGAAMDPSLALAKTVTMAISASIPPYFIKEINSGIEWEIIRESFGKVGYEVEPTFFLPAQRVLAFQKKEVQCASTVARSNVKGVAYSDTVIRFENVAISLEKNNITINGLDDLRGRNIISFVGARNAFGDEFTKIVKDNRRYRERLKNDIIPVLIYRNRVEVAVTDLNIFKYFRNKMSSSIDRKQSITIHRIFPPKEYGLVCHDAAIIKEFNRGLAEVRRTGLYEAIVEKYTKDLEEQKRETEDTGKMDIF